MTEKNDHALAFHEAGHAIVAMKLGYRCRWVAIEPMPRTCCEEPVEHALQILVAARIAEQTYTQSLDIWHDQNDRVRAMNLALWVTDGDTDKAGELISEMLVSARELVDRHWAEIEQLAQELLVNKTVTFDAPDFSSEDA
jgi:hypothetical protein